MRALFSKNVEAESKVNNFFLNVDLSSAGALYAEAVLQHRQERMWGGSWLIFRKGASLEAHNMYV